MRVAQTVGNASAVLHGPRGESRRGASDFDLRIRRSLTVDGPARETRVENRLAGSWLDIDARWDIIRSTPYLPGMR